MYSRREQATKDLMIQYPSYHKYKQARIELGNDTYAYNHSSVEKRWGSWNKGKEYFGLKSIESNNITNGNRKNEEGNIHSNEEILEWVRKFPRKNVFEAEVKNHPYMPSIHTVLTRFQTWTNVRYEATGKIGSAVLDSSAETIVYLVNFINDNVYKVGLTQISVERRARRWPKFKIIETIKLPTLYEARKIERKTLDFYSHWKYYYGEIKANGATECFLFPSTPQIQK